MQEVTIPCHALSRLVILAENGAEPVAIEKKQTVYGTLAGYTVGNVTMRNIEQFTSRITLLLPKDLALQLLRNPYAAAERLYQVHKERLVWYVFAHLRAGNAARPAVADWLELYGIDEDQYSVETAYKLWQRAGWEIDKKNRRFAGRLRTKSAAFLARKSGRRAKFYPPLSALTWTPPDQQAELATSRFMATYCKSFSRLPASLEKQVRIYAYVTIQQLSGRAAAKKLQVPRSSVQRAMAAMHKRASKNPMFRQMIAEISALPQPAEMPAP